MNMETVQFKIYFFQFEIIEWNSLGPEICNIRLNQHPHYCSYLINIHFILKTPALKQEVLPFASRLRTVEREVK